MAFMPSAQRRARTILVSKMARFPKVPASMSRAVTPPPPRRPPIAAAAALPPLPGSYIGALLALLAGVIGLQALGATLNEAILVLEALVAAIAFLAWRRGE
jgi:hypothetical protein